MKRQIDNPSSGAATGGNNQIHPYVMTEIEFEVKILHITMYNIQVYLIIMLSIGSIEKDCVI